MGIRNRKTGLFFGSFNPIHIGHLIIAEFMVSQTDLQEVWLVVSPHSPFKDKKSLAPDYDRLHFARLAIADNDQLRVSDIEFGLPKPSYTIDTLAYLKEKFPERSFALIMGSDNLKGLPKWKNYETLLRHYEVYVYNRPGYPAYNQELPDFAKIHALDAPLMHISSSYIRNCIAKNYSVRYLVPEPVRQELLQTNLYKS